MLRKYFAAGPFAPGARRRFYSRVKNRFLYVTPRYLRYLSQTVVLTPWLMGFFSLYLLAFVPQMQEVYIGVIEDRDIVRGLAGFAAFSAFGALLYFWNHKLVTRRIDGIYPDHADIFFDRGVTGIRNLKTMIVSSLPFAGLCIGLLAARFQVENAAKHVQAVSAALRGPLDRAEALQASFGSLTAGITFSIALTAGVFAGLIFVLHRMRDKPRWQRRFIGTCHAATVFFVAVPVLSSNTALVLSKAIGPLAGTGLVLIAGTVFLRVLIWIAAKIVWAVLTLPSAAMLSLHRVPPALRQSVAVLVPAAVVVLLGAKFVQFSAEMKDRRPASILEEVQERGKTTNKDRETLDRAFAAWLKAREMGSGEYPVFIVSAEGGGIYATSAASLFLAKMQERCPEFAEHIFAVSGVSGGSVGASLFNAALAERPKGKETSRAGGSRPDASSS